MTSAISHDSIVVRIRKLIDKAGNTDFDEEREALLAKATSLMAQYQVDEAMVEAAKPMESRGAIATKVISVGSGPYSRARGALLQSIYQAFGCTAVTNVNWEGRYYELFGYERDLMLTEMLYTSLLLQATSEMMKAEVPDGVKAMSFRRSFLIGFATKVGSRLLQEHNEAISEATETAEEAESVALVMVDREKDAEAAKFERYGKMRSMARAARTQYSGTSKGSEAGGRASLSSNRSVRS